MAWRLLILLGDSVVALIVAAMLNWLALLQVRRSETLHWTERARRLWPIRVGSGSALGLLPVDLCLGQNLLWPAFSPPWALAVLAGFLGAWAGSYPFHHHLFGWLTPRAWFHQLIIWVGFRFGWWFLCLLIICAMPREFDWRALALFTLYPALLAIWLSGGLVWLFRKLKVLIEPPEHLVSLVSTISQTTNITFRKIWVLRGAGDSAFALPYSGGLLFSERLLELHPDDEIAALCAHELGHLSESRLVLFARLLGSMAFGPALFAKPAFYAWGPVGVLLVFTATWLMFLASRHLNRKLEVRADRIGRAHELDPGAYARALARLHEDNLIPAVMPRKTTHPDLYDRLVSADSPPNYPRPEKPSAISWQAFVLAVLCGVLIVATIIPFLSSPTKPFDEQQGSTQARLASMCCLAYVRQRTKG